MSELRRMTEAVVYLPDGERLRIAGDDVLAHDPAGPALIARDHEAGHPEATRTFVGLAYEIRSEPTAISVDIGGRIFRPGV